MRQILSTALVALVVAALTAVTVSAVAQSPAEPAIGPAAIINADTVDGLSAVKATRNTKTRANKLVATNANGFLPSNIIKAVTGVTVTRVQGPKSAPQADGVTFAYAYCPEGTLLVGGGADIAVSDGSAANVTHFLSNQPGGSRNWFARAWKQLGTGGSYQVQAFAICLSTEPAGNLSLAGRVTQATTKKGR